jgi:NAD(P)-dependent dehydrogenase (short-subunit alcohol dehydrogenase family)
MKNLFSYEGKRVVITGASSGMGEATAHLVHSLGAQIVAIDIQPPRYDFAEFHAVDLRDPAAIEAVVETVTASHVDNLFYCAGLPAGRFSALDVVTVNFIALRHMVELMAKKMTRGDAIVCVSSGAGMGYSYATEQLTPIMEMSDFRETQAQISELAKEEGFEPYSFSKMCSILYTLRAAATITTDSGVRVNCTSPGPTDTAMMPAFVEQSGADFMDRYPKPIGRNSTAEEQAWPLAFLNSAAASYISGENLYTDGGACNGLLNGALDVTLFMPDA